MIAPLPSNLVNMLEGAPHSKGKCKNLNVSVNWSYFWILWVVKCVIHEFHGVIIGRGWPIWPLATLCCDYFKHLKICFAKNRWWHYVSLASRLTVAGSQSQSFWTCLDRILWGSIWRNQPGAGQGRQWADSRWWAGGPPASRPGAREYKLVVLTVFVHFTWYVQFSSGLGICVFAQWGGSSQVRS